MFKGVKGFEIHINIYFIICWYIPCFSQIKSSHIDKPKKEKENGYVR